MCSDASSKFEYLDKAVAGVRGNCSFYKKGTVAQSAGGKAAIIINNEDHLVLIQVISVFD